MNIITSFLQLIRWKNLIIIAMTQLMIWLLIIQPFFATIEVNMFLTFPKVLILVLSTISIAAAGYIINDYFDVHIDLINKPDEVIIEKFIPRRTAILLHSLLNFFGMLLAAYVAFEAQSFWLLAFPVASTLLLWFYATDFKGAYLYGNLLVALLIVLSIVMIPIYESELWPYLMVRFGLTNGLVNPWMIIAVYSFFAFLLTWIRELVKDMEDFKGDFQQGCETLPIKLGIQKATAFTRVLVSVAFLVLLLSAVFLIYQSFYILATYLLLVLCPLLLYLWIQLPKGVDQAHFYKLSQLLKWLMVLGILALGLVYILIY